MKKTILMLSLLIAVPAVSQKVKSPNPDAMSRTIKNLEETIEEQEERLRIHKAEIEALRKLVLALESRLASLEKGTVEHYATARETPQH